MPLGLAGIALGSAAIGAAGSVASSALGSEGEPPVPGGVPGSGNVTDKRAGPIDRFLGTPKGVLATQVGGQFLGDFRQRRANKNRFSDLKDEGLTPQEIMGGGGGAVQAQGNTLGSGPQQQAAHQQAFQADQAQKERDNKLKIAQIQTGPSKTQAVTAIDRLEMDKTVNRQKIIQIRAQVEKLELENSNFFAKIAAQMGPENIKAALIMYKNGINFQTILQALQLPNRQQEIIIQDILNEIQKESSLLRKEYEGLTFDIESTYNKYMEPFKLLGKELKIKAKQLTYNHRNPK